MKAIIRGLFRLRCHYIKRQILTHLLNICQKYLKMAITSLENGINRLERGEGSMEWEKEKREGGGVRDVKEREGGVNEEQEDK